MSAWWQTAVIYQIYPRSFQDSNGDGVGDIPGIISRLDYLEWLGVDAIWLSPIYQSPMVDFGYDVADYCAIDPVFGTMQDFDRLLEDAHRRGLRVIMDFVPNHTSDQHPWFKESRSSRQNPKRDWYIWQDGRHGGPPNNWLSESTESAWTLDAATGQYYYHRFQREQPDLNWRNPAVLDAMRAVMTFWLEKGVDGFRVDAATSLVEDGLLRDEPVEQGPSDKMRRLRHAFTVDRPETHQCIAALRAHLERYPDKVLIGEAHMPVARLMEYYGETSPGFQLPFNFTLLDTEHWDASTLGAAIDQYMLLLPQRDWPNWVLGNHDVSRIATRVGPRMARLGAMLALTMRGTPFIYYGEEIGAEDIVLPPEQWLDPNGRRGGKERDGERAPMPWNGEANGGFTSGTPWLPLAADASRNNVAAQREDPQSMLSLYRALIHLRKTELTLRMGDHQA
ncbi:MAG TPA: alpha-amylase family glycosyl hydrolase, partial [Devosia sp.]|nr:alpha-amylase family glycosyl hydrolase [Devosia sp.]